MPVFSHFNAVYDPFQHFIGNFGSTQDIAYALECICQPVFKLVRLCDAELYQILLSIRRLDTVMLCVLGS